MSPATITTEAKARRKHAPDLANVEVATVGEGKAAAVARAAASDRSDTIRESITMVSAEQIRTVEICVEDADDMFAPDTEVEFHATERLTIECLPEAAEEVVIDVTEAGGTVQSVQFGLHPDRHRQLEDEALTAAMERAREKAECLATAEGLAVENVQSVSTTEQPSGMEDIVDEALANLSETGLSPTPVVVSEAVEVEYELTER